MEPINLLAKKVNLPFYMPDEILLEKKGTSSETVPDILCITTFPPRQCGIATYSQDLIKAMQQQFVNSFNIKVCALENDNEKHSYSSQDVNFTLNTSERKSYLSLAKKINTDSNIKSVLLQHEFGLFAESISDFNDFLAMVKKPIVVVFHTVLPRPDDAFKKNVQFILDHSAGIIVMTNVASEILVRDYVVASDKIAVIAHGTHLVKHLDKIALKEKYGFQDRKILTTFGLLSSGKSIETTLDALPNIISTTPDVLFLIIGKTHPTVVLNEGEKYRESLQLKIKELGLESHVAFINRYVELDELLEYLQLTDIYVFSSKDPNQAVSGTFSYALSCGCPVVSTPIPHAKEVLANGTGLLYDFQNSEQLAEAVNTLLFDVELRDHMISQGLHKITGTAWENSAVAHAKFIEKITPETFNLHYCVPEVNLDHLARLTTDFGMLQFCKKNEPDLSSGYTIDDNARALIAMCQYYKANLDASSLKFIVIYLNFLSYCERRGELFYNYVDIHKKFTKQNMEVNLEDPTGRAIWALGYVLSLSDILPEEITNRAKTIFDRNILLATNIHSPRAISFIIKGLYYYNRTTPIAENCETANLLASRLVQNYRHSSSDTWHWFENYLTYANSIMPEALLCAYAITDNKVYRDIAKKSFDFLLSKTFTHDHIKVISNKSWYKQGEEFERFGEQPIDVAYTVIALRKFYDIFKDKGYLDKMEVAFNWFHGNNHLSQVLYNPCTGGCFDGLEEFNVNLNQGAESTVSYLMARMTVNKFFENDKLFSSRRRIKSTHRVIN